MFMKKSNDMTISPAKVRLSSEQIGLIGSVGGFFPGGGRRREEGFLHTGGDGVAGLEAAEQKRECRIGETDADT